MSSISSLSNSVSQNQFLSLLVAELQNQDPTNPVDATQSVTQLAQFSTLQGVQSLGASFDQMLQLQALTSGVDLIGRTVQYQDSSGQTQSGKVSNLSVVNGQVVLTVGNAQVPLGNVSEVSS